jgi:hypothetical protein
MVENNSMSEEFDSNKFESLSNIPLGMYAVNLAKSGNLPPNCLDYFRSNAVRWDGQHLECGLLFLSKLDDLEANHEIANHVGHSLTHIRFTVLGMLNDLRPLDDYMTQKLYERLSVRVDEFESDWIKRLYEKAKLSKELAP